MTKMMNDIEMHYPSALEVERHVREAQKLRAQMMSDLLKAAAKAITPNLRKATTGKTAPKAAATA
ncbi:MAG: hypothetical protein MRY63_04015 [Neomegalonema sp.]|nr:hypothetical protein [Neomegalonema sp.]